jgi:hypothetical protein
VRCQKARLGAPFRPGDADHAKFVRRVAASYPSNVEIARQWAETAAAVVHAPNALSAGQRVAAQGHELAIGDSLATLAVEATIHHLDLAADAQLRGSRTEGLAVVRHTLDGILDRPVPADWDDTAYALKGPWPDGAHRR